MAHDLVRSIFRDRPAVPAGSSCRAVSECLIVERGDAGAAPSPAGACPHRTFIAERITKQPHMSRHRLRYELTARAAW